jgi:hypothetical protein
MPKATAPLRLSDQAILYRLQRARDVLRPPARGFDLTDCTPRLAADFGELMGRVRAILERHNPDHG